MKTRGAPPVKAPPLDPVNDSNATSEHHEAEDHFHDQLILKSFLCREHKSRYPQDRAALLAADPPPPLRTKNTDSAATLALTLFEASQAQTWRSV